MTTDTRLLMGEIIEDPEGEKRNVEELLSGLLDALIKEQNWEQSWDQNLAPAAAKESP